MDTVEVLRAIALMDSEQIRQVYDAAKQRDKFLRDSARREAVATMRVGDRVELTGLRPQYVNGATGTINSVRNLKFVVVLDENVDPRVRLRYGSRVTVPASGIKAVA